MAHARLTILKHHERELRTWLQGHKEGHERAALVLLRRFRHASQDLTDSDRYQVVEVHPVPDEWVTSSGPDHVAFPMRHLRPLFQSCEERGLSLGYAHSHPSGFADFSAQDDQNELAMLQALANRNGPHATLVAILLSSDRLSGRVRRAAAPEITQSLRHILVVDYPLRIHLGNTSKPTSPHGIDPEVWARQCAALGEPFQNNVRTLRIGVVGAGGTGGAAITLSARCGASELVLIDPQLLEKTNLNRVRGARMADVGRQKVEIVRDFVHSLGLGTKVHLEFANVDESPAAVDALAACDVVLGCTDDVLGRSALNALAYRHGVVVIDMGLGGTVAPPAGAKQSSIANLRFYQHARITTLLPGVPGCRCMRCEEVFNEKDLHEATFLRANPNPTPAQLKENYITGGMTQAPGVGPFTSAAADFALMQLYDLLQDLRSRRTHPDLRRSSYNIDFMTMQTSSRAPASAECALCHTADSGPPIGLLQDNELRLGRPALGPLPRHE